VAGVLDRIPGLRSNVERRNEVLIAPSCAALVLEAGVGSTEGTKED